MKGCVRRGKSEIASSPAQTPTFENGIGGKETNRSREFLGGHAGVYQAAGQTLRSIRHPKLIKTKKHPEGRKTSMILAI
jgi:hypothetical protein